MANQVSELFDAAIWQQVAGFENQTDITYHQHVSLGVVRVAFNRPEIRNAFRPKTVDELAASQEHAKNNSKGRVVLLTVNGPSP
jgi:naphthoate synthase